MAQFENSNFYNATENTQLKADVKIEAGNLSLDSVVLNNETPTGEVDLDSLSFATDTPSSNAINYIRDYLGGKGIKFDQNNIEYSSDGSIKYYDPSTETTYIFDSSGRIKSEKSNGFTVTYDNGDSNRPPVSQVFKDNNIYVDSDLNIEFIGDMDDFDIYLAGDNLVEIYHDGRVLINGIDVTGSKSVKITNQGINIETNNGTLTITNDEQIIFFGTNGEKFTGNLTIDELFQSLSAVETDSLNVNNITADKNGNLYYHDNISNSEFEYDSAGRLKNFKKGNVKVEYNYNPTKEDKEKIRSIDGDNYGTEDFEINFVATATINGHEMMFYSIGDQGDVKTTGYPIAAALAYSDYNERILEFIEKYYFGTIIGPWELSDRKTNHDSVGAYANSSYSTKKGYIFVPYDACAYIDDFYRFSVPLHEMAHIIHFFSKGRFHKENGQEEWFGDVLYDMYEKYAGIMPTLPHSGYSSEKYSESPDVNEFFADASANYFSDPDSLKRYCPELYEFLNKVYGEENYYAY